MLLDKPSLSLAVVSGIVLFLVLLCDHYYFFYCILAGAIICLSHLWSHRDTLSLLARQYLVPFAAFSLVTAATSGVLVGSLLLANARDHFTGAHPTQDFSLDLLAPFIYRGHWRFSALTRGYWARLPGGKYQRCRCPMLGASRETCGFSCSWIRCAGSMVSIYAGNRTTQSPARVAGTRRPARDAADPSASVARS